MEGEVLRAKRYLVVWKADEYVWERKGQTRASTVNLNKRESVRQAGRGRGHGVAGKEQECNGVWWGIAGNCFLGIILVNLIYSFG